MEVYLISADRGMAVWLSVVLMMLTFVSVEGAEVNGVKELAVKAPVGLNDPIIRPYESAKPPVRVTPLDLLVRGVLKAKGISPARPCSDEVFVRRVYFDVTGTLPPRRDVLYFLNSKDEGKRAKLIDALLAKDEYTDYWTLKVCV